MTSAQPTLERIRAATVESTHLSAITVIGSNGKLPRFHGDPDTVAFLRSSAKPFQALPWVEWGGAQH